MPKYIINSVDMNFRELIIVSISSYVIVNTVWAQFLLSYFKQSNINGPGLSVCMALIRFLK